jgi:hypothetical protein
MIWSGTLDERICLMYRENKNPFCQENSEPLNSTSARRTWVEKDLYLPGNTLKAKVYPGWECIEGEYWWILQADPSAAASQVVVYICHRQIHASFDDRARG